MKPIVFTYTTCGNQEVNEDVIYVQEINDSCACYILADGMSGYSNGALAAQTIVDEISQYILSNIHDIDVYSLIHNAVDAANDAIKTKSNALHCKMGATVSMLLRTHDILTVAWIGDVRVYRICDGILNQLTIDHTLEDYPSIVTRSVKGKEFEKDIPITQMQYSINDTYIICSDGFYKAVNIDDIRYCPIEEIPNLLLDVEDDCSVIVVGK